MASHTSGGIPKSRPAQQQQANFDRKQLDAIDWSAVPKSFGARVQRFGAWHVWTTEAVAQSTAYINPLEWVIAVHPETWRILSFKTEVQMMFLKNMSEGAAGIKFISMDSGPYGEVARLAMERDQPKRKDVLETLSSEAQSLIIQASGLAGGASPAQIKLFIERFTALKNQLEDVEVRVSKVRSLVDVAGDAVLAVCD